MKRKEFTITMDGVVVTKRQTWNAAMIAVPKLIRGSAGFNARYTRDTIATRKDEDGLDHVFGIFEWVSDTNPRVYRFTIERTK